MRRSCDADKRPCLRWDRDCRKKKGSVKKGGKSLTLANNLQHLWGIEVMAIWTQLDQLLHHRNLCIPFWGALCWNWSYADAGAKRWWYLPFCFCCVLHAFRGMEQSCFGSKKFNASACGDPIYFGFVGSALSHHDTAVNLCLTTLHGDG